MTIGRRGWSRPDSRALDAAASALSGFSAGQAFGPGVDAGYDLWFPSIAADAAARCGTDQLRSDLYDLLSPFAGTHVGCGAFVAYAGRVDHCLGVLAAAHGKASAAQAHAAAAAEQCQHLGAPRWQALTGARLRSACVFRRAGAIWTISYAGVDGLLPDAKGLRDIATLLVRPLQPVPATELAGMAAPSHGEPTLDRRALVAYRTRLRDLDDDIDTAEADHDLERATPARLEREALVDELRRTTRLGGRPRRLGDDTERARQTVTARIHRALRTIEQHHPSLAAHLRTTVETGTTCCYRPTNPIKWTV